ncbi:type II secretion system protein N [Marinobacter sp. CHS3-4]|uniref:type II secretion system protein N n=1 Tax=Marinobacter sp. CHS3-4 TaxID=3045174 RepID=UPI0024B4D5F8|nr:type II secretion system protein N [Marinobacter sp. CHS3-4]MDI9245029.1 type II secretion system protein N [Marinobacter sp. CHS3-4]
MTESPKKAFLRPGKVFLLTLAGVLVYLGALVFLVPAGWLWQQAQSQVPLPPEVQVQQINGHLWEGVAGLVIAGFPVRCEWRLSAPSFSSLTLPIDFSLSTGASTVSGDLRVDWQGNGQVNAQGRIAVSEFESLIRRSGGAVIEGDVSIERLTLAWADQRLTRADGLGRWAGGNVTWPMGNGQGQAEFPAMRATLDSTSEGINLLVSEEAGDGPAATATIRWTGMMDIRVYKRMVDLAQQPWPDSAKPDDVIFRVRQPLIPGGALR